MSSFLPSPVIVIFCTVTSATYWKNGRAYSATLAYAVAILGSILVNALPNEKYGLLFSYWISSTSSSSQHHLHRHLLPKFIGTPSFPYLLSSVPHTPLVSLAQSFLYN